MWVKVIQGPKHLQNRRQTLQLCEESESRRPLGEGLPGGQLSALQVHQGGDGEAGEGLQWMSALCRPSRLDRIEPSTYVPGESDWGP